ncbi:MAG: DNA internalization-related competence protein ComEC/Rec2 [Burkholderiaceae bacterium]
MRVAACSAVLGVCLLQAQAALPSPPLLGGLAAATLLAAAAPMRWRTGPRRVAAVGVCAALCGFLWAALLAQHRLADALPPSLEGHDVTVAGVVDSLPDRFAQGVRFHFRIEKVLDADGDPPAVLPERVALSWYAPRGGHSGHAGDVRAGERWRLTVRLKRPHGNANPGGFDYEAWLLEQDLRATGYVRDNDGPRGNARLDAFVPTPNDIIERGRGWLRARILAALPDAPYAGVIVALVIGDQRGIDQSDWDVFNRTGISHLVSISGLHITMIAGLFGWLAGALWRRSFFTGAELPLRLPAQKVAALAGALAALVYVALAGFGVPAQRTLVMLSVVAFALWTGRIASLPQVLAAALLAVVALDPWAVLWPGFWLSFGAVAVILYAAGDEGRAAAGWRARFGAATRMQYAITVGLIPLTLLLFGQVSLVSPLANAIAIPLVSLLVAPLSLFGSVLPAPLCGWVLHGAHWLVAQLAALLGHLAALPAAVWAAPQPSWPLFLLGLGGTAWLLAPRGWPARWLGLFCWLPLAANAPARPVEGALWVTAFDVGQGMALLVETPHHRLLYDTGPAYSPESDAGGRVILPYLKARGIGALDAVVISHNDNDHSGGALSLFEAIDVGWAATSLASDSPIVRAAPHHRHCEAGQAWNWDGVRFEMLYPTPAVYDGPPGKPNARSCTLKITLGSRSILLAGDIEAPQEAELLRTSAQDLRATVLLAPHHGSGTSSTLPFLEAVHPEVAVFQVGYRNRFRHPKPEVFARYGALGIRRLRTDQTGAVAMRFGDRLDIEEYRTEHGRYWQGR